MRKFGFSLVLIFIPFFAFGTNFTMDARSMGQASTGVASATFLSAPFYNPALAALGFEQRTYGVLFPTLGMRFKDPEKLVKNMEDFGGVFDRFANSPNDANVKAQTLMALRSLQNKRGILSGGIAGSAGIATQNLSGLFFISAFTEGVATAEVSAADISAINAANTGRPTSIARVIGAGIIDVGLNLANHLDIVGIPLAIGISPKIQQIYTYHQEENITSFDLSDWTDITNRTDKSTLNLDFGLAWQQEVWRLGFVVKNIFSKELISAIRTKTFTYKLNPLYSLGGAWRKDNWQVSVDMDLNSQERFLPNAGTYLNDETQLLKFGAEYVLNKKVQLRAGFIHDLDNNIEQTYSFGLGVGIDELVRVDLALELVEKRSYGAAVQLSFSI